MAAATTRAFTHEGHRLVFDEYGSGARTVVLLPGLLFPRTMHRPMATALAERGNRVICLDLLGHGESDRPDDMTEYSMTIYARQVVGLLDHLELDEVVLGGTSLGANVTLETAALAPERLRGMVVEMPVLDNALLGCALAFTPLLIALTFGAPVTRNWGRLMARVPRGAWHLGDLALDWMSQDPAPSAAVLQGLFFGRVAPPREERREIGVRALVLGHPRDPIHPFSDADALVRELPDARMLEADSFFELRLSPERLTGEIVEFVDHCWAARRSARRTTRGRTAAAR